MNRTTRAALALATAAILLPRADVAEEGGSGHYTPGGNASFIDGLPSKPGLALGDYFSYYTASAGSTQRVPTGGLVTAGLDATAYANTLLALYRTPFKLLTGWYELGVAVPYVWLTVSGDAQLTGPRGATFTSSLRDTGDGIGDILAYPFMLGWTELGGDLRYDVRLGVYIPSGSYHEGDLANVGKNYWTVEPAVSFQYLSGELGLELSAFAGVDLNTKNEATDYRSGNQVHVDVTVAEHLPLLGGAVGVGANGFWYQQLTGDSGAGAVLGDFKGRTLGVGPVLSYITKLWSKPLALEVKWLPELEVKNRLDGDYVWAKLGLQL